MNEQDTNFRDFDLIESYLMEDMNADERKSFELELEERADLREELEIQKDLVKAIQIGGLKEELKEIHEQQQSASTRSSRIPVWGIAASIAVILTIGLWLSQPSDPTNADLFAEYSTTDPGLPVTMGASDNYVFKDAMVDYKQGDYQTAINKWIELQPEFGASDTLNYYLAMAHFNLEEYDQAENYIAQVRTSTSNRLRAKAQWYEVLIALRTNDVDFIKSLEIVEGSEYEREILEIKEILKR
jgi:hypothetical protein